MVKYKAILKVGFISALCAGSYITIKNLPEKELVTDSVSTIEDLMKETKFKLEFKNLNELEYTVQDSTVDIKDTGLNKTFSNNNKFDIKVDSSGKVSCINYTSELSDLSELDIDYMKKVYSFVFGTISTFILEETNETIEKVQGDEYINSNKVNIINNGYLQESIQLSKTSELKFTTYYERNQDKIKAYKISIDILQGNKW